MKNGKLLCTSAQLSKLCEANWATVKKYIDLEGLQPVKRKDMGNRDVCYYDQKKALRLLLPHLKQQERHRQKEKNLDPETGLTWAQRKMREEAIEKARANRIADKLEGNVYLTWENHHKILSAMMKKLDQAVDKSKSELALTDHQALRLRRIFDDARKEASAEVGAME